MDSAQDYVEIEVKPRGHHQFGIKKKVEAARASGSIILGKDPTGVYPVFIQGPAGSDTKIAINNSLARGCKVRATGRHPNVFLKAIPFVAYYRAGMLDTVKRHLNGDSTSVDFASVDWEVEAHKRQKKWKEGGPWGPPDQFASYTHPLPAISLDAISWGIEEPYDSIPAFENYELTDTQRCLIVQLRSKITHDYVSLRQLIVYTFWWCHYKKRDPNDYQGFMGADVPYEPVPLVIFAIIMPTVLREAEDDGLVAYPSLMLAVSTRAAVEFPKDGAEWEVLKIETQTIEDQILNGFVEPDIAASLLPGDLIGTKNEPFSNSQLMKSNWASWDSTDVPHHEAVRPTTDMLGDINTIFRPHPGSNARLKFRTLIPLTESQQQYEVLRNYRGRPDLERLCQANLNKGIYIHLALPTSSETRVDRSSLANKPHHIIVDVDEQAMEDSNTAVSRRIGALGKRPVKTEALPSVKREYPVHTGLINHTGSTCSSRDGHIEGQHESKRPCLLSNASSIPPATGGLAGHANRSNNGSSTRRPSQTAVPTAMFASQNDVPQTDQVEKSRQHVHKDQVLNEAFRQGWVAPSQIRDAARKQGLIDPADERDQGTLQHWGYEKTMLRATPVPLSFKVDTYLSQHLADDVPHGGQEICSTLRNDPTNGVLSALRVTLSSFSPLTNKLQGVLKYMDDGPVTASDLIALQHVEEGLDELLTVCSRMALLSRILAEAKDRHREDRQRIIPLPLTSRLADLLYDNFQDNLPRAFYERVCSCRWDHEDDQYLVKDILRWSRDLCKFWYASAVVVERCCAAVDRGCHQHFLTQSRSRLWRDWVAPWKTMDGPWRLQRKHERCQQGEVSTSSSASTLFEPGTKFIMPTLGRELQCELLATAISDLSGNEDIANWLHLPCDTGRSVEPLAVKLSDKDELYLHKGRVWYR